MSWFDKYKRKARSKQDINWPTDNTDADADTNNDDEGQGTVEADNNLGHEPTLNDVSEYISEMQEALHDTRRRMFRKDYSSPKLAPLVAKLEKKIPTLTRTILPPLIKNSLMKHLNPLVQRASDLGDKYIPKLMDDLDAGILEHIPHYLWLSYLNQTRLKYGKDPAFSDLRTYIKTKYNDDIADPSGHTAFVPAKEAQYQSIWDKVEFLEEAGLVLVRENVVLRNTALGEERNLAIITMSDHVG